MEANNKLAECRQVQQIKAGLYISRCGRIERGGIATIVSLIKRVLGERGIDSSLLKGGWPNLNSHLIIIGCSNPWAMLQIIRHRYRYPKGKTEWLPCYHIPRYTKHPIKAKLAKTAIKISQLIGVRVLTLSKEEQNELNAGSCHLVSIGFARADEIRIVTNESCRTADIVFVGRPTRQKGYDVFLDVARLSGLTAVAFIPYSAKEQLRSDVTVDIRIGRSDKEIIEGLQRSKVLLVPSDYESFGFAQAEAIENGCCVPIMGKWPLWEGLKELEWKDLSNEEIIDRLYQLIADRAKLNRLTKKQKEMWDRKEERWAPLWP